MLVTSFPKSLESSPGEFHEQSVDDVLNVRVCYLAGFSLSCFQNLLRTFIAFSCQW